jgi:sugar phosphate permease
VPEQNIPEMTEKKTLKRLVLIFSVLSLFYVFSVFYRVCNAVIAPNLVLDLNFNAETLGILGGAFFYAFALVQIPMGPMLDRMGPRIVLTVFPLIGALGAFLFSAGESFTTALLGRILIGVGMSPLLMGALKTFLLRFPLERFSTLMGLYIAIGNLGNVLGAAPLAYATAAFGWRKTFYVASIVTAVFAFLAFWVLREGNAEDRDPRSSPLPEPAFGILQSMRMVLGSLTFWQIASVSFFRYGTFIGLQGLWLGPYLMDIHGFSPIAAGKLLAFIAVGTIAGGPLVGWITDRTGYSKKRLTLFGLTLYGLSLFPLCGIVKVEGYYAYFPLFLTMGFTNSSGMLVTPHATGLFPGAISGTVMTLINFFPMAGGALFMPLMGRIIESFPRVGHAYPAQAYHVSFFVCFLCMAASLIFYAFSKKDR